MRERLEIAVIAVLALGYLALLLVIAITIPQHGAGAPP